MATPLSWIEIDTRAIAANIRAFKTLLPEDTRLLAVVKGEAYGHGMVPVAMTALRAGADWLGVFSLAEAEELRSAGILAPVLLLGYVPFADMGRAAELNLRLTVSSPESIDAAGRAAASLGRRLRLHLKVETGTHRLGVDPDMLDDVLGRIHAQASLVLEGVHTHYANIEDTTEHDYARGQQEEFARLLQRVRAQGFDVPFPHTACTAAAILFPQTYFAMVRVGIGVYGLWPSKETLLSARMAGREPLELQPAMCWKTRVVQVKDVPAGSYVGYGCTYRTTRPSRLAVLPVGYANGYDRLLSNRGHVLIKGVRAPVRGRVCMNLTMVDVSDIPGVELEEEVVLLGPQGDERITAEQMAAWAQTINYEVVTRADPYAQRDFIGLQPDEAQPEEEP